MFKLIPHLFLFAILITFSAKASESSDNKSTHRVLQFESESSDNKSTHRELQFENEHVKVWKTTIMPHQPLKLHRHDCSRVVVGLKGGSLTIIEETGEKSQLILKTGKAYWFSADPIGTLHGDINESDEPIVVMLIEIKELSK